MAFTVDENLPAGQPVHVTVNPEHSDLYWPVGHACTLEQETQLPSDDPPQLMRTLPAPQFARHAVQVDPLLMPME